MKMIVIALALGVAGAPRGEAADTKASTLELKPKAALMAPARSRSAPFTMASVEPELELAPRQDARHEASRSSCSGDRSLCYDAASGRIVYKPARAFMPDIPGLQPENISVKRDRIVLRYSF